MGQSLQEIIALYNPAAPLEQASTIPAPWYVDTRMAELEQQTVFGRNWLVAGRADQVTAPGAYFTTEVAGEPVVVVRGNDRVLRAFFNVCRHHAATVMPEPCGKTEHLRCPYHGWTYGLDGALKGMTEFEGVANFDRSKNGLVPVQVEVWEKFVFVNLDPHAGTLRDFLGGLARMVQPLALDQLHFLDRREYTLDCNWKVYVDNYLDGGYHVPFMHKGLNSVIDFKEYMIRNEDRYCEQSSPMRSENASDAMTGATRRGERAYYLWQYPNFMLNWYEGVMDTNLVLPLGVDRCRVIFDFYFAQTDEESNQRNRQSIEVSGRVQDEDEAVCVSVQRGLKSRAYVAGRLSVRREAGEHLFHRLLHADLQGGVTATRAAD